MQIQPREQILDIWRALIAYSNRDGKWVWAGRAEPNSISDAELLLCILYPATNVPALRFDRADQTARDVLDSLSGLGNDFEIPRVFVKLLTDYMERYRNEQGHPVFPGGSYIQPEFEEGNPTTEQQNLELVDSFSMSVTLSLSTIGFLQVLRTGIRNQSTLAEIDHLHSLASQRLTAAMTGLLRSFSVRVFDYDSPTGINLCRMINQGREPDRIVAERLSDALTDIRSRLREELSIGSGQVSEELENASRLFECGWSWGVVRGANKIDYTEDITSQDDGFAEDRPYLYFTGVALDGIEDLFTPRTRILGLLNETQQRLAQALQLRFQLSLGFWNRIATFNEGRWPAEDVPWMTTDGIESDYFTLFIGSMVSQAAVLQDSGLSTASLIRLGNLLSELATRGRITRRPSSDDAALSLHDPGIRMRLYGSETLGARQSIMVSCYSSMLLKRVVRLASRISESTGRDRLTQLADEIWRHVEGRRMIDNEGEGLWDQPLGVLPVESPPFSEPSWYHTQKVVECLVAASWSIDIPLRVSEPLVATAREYLLEAEHLFDQERLYGREAGGQAIRDTFRTVSANLERARKLLQERPATASVLAQRVLEDLDKMARARVGSLELG